MRSQRPSRTTTGSLTHLTSNPTEGLLISDVPQPTQDGGNCSDIIATSLKTKKERFWISQETLMLKTETSLFMPNMEE